MVSGSNPEGGLLSPQARQPFFSSYGGGWIRTSVEIDSTDLQSATFNHSVTPPFFGERSLPLSLRLEKEEGKEVREAQGNTGKHKKKTSPL
jgi:hypothetical protein